jgi:chemotaxis protein methyltransferase CheR
MVTDPNKFELEDLEIDLLLQGIYRHYGFDFRDYAISSLRRRVWNILVTEKLPTITALLDKILHDEHYFERFLLHLSVNVSQMFRDPGFYLAFRTRAIELLKTFPFVRIWVAGCSTGEEAYSIAITLQEEGLYDRCRIYATDINESVLRKAKAGVYPLKDVQKYTTNYISAGGKRSFSEYYTAAYDNVILHSSLKENIIFSQHNLVTDVSFNEFNVVLCRNVMIYFNKTLQSKVHKLLYESLSMFGILGVGANETLSFTPYENRYEELEPRTRLYRKIA